MRKYLPHILIISFVFILTLTAHVASYAGEIEDAKEYVRNNPDDADAHFYLGNAYGRSGKYEEAIKSFKQALRIDPDYALAHCKLGVAYGISGMRKEGMNSLKQAIRIDPRLPQAHYALGGGYLAEGDRSSALGEYEILKELDTEWANKLFNLIYRE